MSFLNGPKVMCSSLFSQVRHPRAMSLQRRIQWAHALHWYFLAMDGALKKLYTESIEESRGTRRKLGTIRVAVRKPTRHRMLLDSKCNAEGFLWLYFNVQNKKVTETGSLPSVGTIGFGSDSMIFSAAENIKGTGIRLYPPSESFAVPIESCDRRKTEPAQRISTWSLLYRGGLYSEGEVKRQAEEKNVLELRFKVNYYISLLGSAMYVGWLHSTYHIIHNS